MLIKASRYDKINIRVKIKFKGINILFAHILMLEMSAQEC